MAQVLVPWRSGCPYRERAWAWVRERVESEGFDVVEAVAADGDWCKASALTPAIEASDAEIVVIHDADVFTEGLAAAVGAVEAGASWAIPHQLVHRLDEEATESVLAGADWLDQPLAQRPYRGIEGGGVVVAPREVLAAIGFDPRFIGWGQEDEAFGVALETLVGPPWRGDADLVHCWHPPQERWTRRRGSPESWHLRNRYLAARDDPAAMRALIEESRDRPTADEPIGDHPPALH